MKKLSLFLFIALGVFFISCENDNDNDDEIAFVDTNDDETDDENTNDNEIDDVLGLLVKPEDVIGTWQVTGYLVEDGQTTTTANGESLTIDYTATGKDYDMTLSFTDDPKTVISNGSYTIILNSTFEGESSTQEQVATAAFENSEWNITDEVLLLINNGTESTVQLTELTETKIVMELDIDEEIAFDANTNITTTGKLTITLEK